MREIKICMGSACFAKGNQENLEFIKNYLDENNLEAKIKLTGDLCGDKCEKGPRVIIDEEEYTNITRQKLAQILKNNL
ncbi:MAG: (2Fe-2S) ferredoxin domain-containing protein [Candidatus Avigastranaerophilus sp.]